MLGKPPFTPGDYIDIYIDEESKIFLDTAQGMEKPLSLSPDEWNTLFQVTETCSRYSLMPTDKIENIYNILKKLTSLEVQNDVNSSLTKKRVIEEASEEKLQLQFSYRSIHSREPELRRVDPYAVFSYKGNFYLAAFCHLRSEIRYFHLERMENPVILDMEFTTQIPDNLVAIFRESPIFQSRKEGYTVTFAFYKSLYTSLKHRLNLTDIYRMTESEYPFQDGWYKASAKIQDILWFKMIIKSLGRNIFILSPDHLRVSLKEEISKVPLPARICE